MFDLLCSPLLSLFYNHLFLSYILSCRIPILSRTSPMLIPLCLFLLFPGGQLFAEEEPEEDVSYKTERTRVVHCFNSALLSG